MSFTPIDISSILPPEIEDTTPSILKLLNLPFGNRLQGKPFEPYVLSVREKIKEICSDQGTMMENSEKDYGFSGGYFEVVGHENSWTQIVDIVISLVLPGDSYLDNDIYTAMYHALDASEFIYAYCHFLERGNPVVTVSKDNAYVENYRGQESFSPYLRERLLHVSFDDIDGRGDADLDIDQAKKMLLYSANLVFEITSTYCKFIEGIFQKMEGVRLDEEVRPEDIQKLWKEKYAPL